MFVGIMVRYFCRLAPITQTFVVSYDHYREHGMCQSYTFSIYKLQTICFILTFYYKYKVSIFTTTAVLTHLA